MVLEPVRLLPQSCGFLTSAGISLANRHIIAVVYKLFTFLLKLLLFAVQPYKETDTVSQGNNKADKAA